MLTDVHCHPFDLITHFPAAEDERRKLGVICAASAATIEEFEYCEKLSLQAKADGAAPLLPCFAIHPQWGGMRNEELEMRYAVAEGLEQIAFLEKLAASGRLAAIGETGFDLFNAAFRETERWQEEMFAAHLEIALRYDLPLVIHARRAMHKIFSYSAGLKKCRAVVFHSWSGTAGEGEALVRRGINAFFSFGTAIMLNHREAMHCCAAFPADRLLTETDAPFQPLRGREFSGYTDIVSILHTMESLRGETGMEQIIETNFRNALGV
ncbi:MAG: TatD family hydrolase [Treponema sp.]|nr:TatD family hydrolase [Treponema sp.]